MNFIPPQDETRLRAAASGTLPNGKAVVVNSDGTVSVITATGGGAALGNVASAGFAGDSGLVVSSLSSTKFVAFAASDSGNSNYGTAIIGTVSGSSISFGTKVSTSVNSYEAPAVAGLSETKFILVYKDYNDSNKGKARVGTVSGTSISFGSVVTFEGGQTSLNQINTVARLSDTKFVIAFEDASDNSKAKSIVGTISGTSVSFGSAATFATPNSSKFAAVSALSDTKVVIAWSDTPTSKRGRAIIGTISGTSISYGSAVNYDTSQVIRHSIAALSDTKFVIAYQDGGNSSYGTAICGTVSGTSITLGTAVVFNSATLNNDWPSVTKIDENQFGIAFRDSANSSYAALIIGTASGTSLSFGTKISNVSSANPDKIWSTLVGTTNFVIGYDLTQLSAVNYQLSSSNLTSENYIGMSGGAVSFTGSAATLGSEAVFESATVSYTNAAFDSNSNKVVVAYNDGGNSSSGTAVVGTVSGSSITFGTPAVFNSGSNTEWISVAFDSNSNKIVIAYMDAGNSSYGTAIVGTVSNTSISFGSEVVFNSGSSTRMDMCFDSNSNKIVIAFADVPAGEDGTAIVGTVSGTSISFGNKQAFHSEQVEHTAITFDSNSNKVVIAYSAFDGGDKMSAVVGTVSGTSISFGSTASILSGSYGIYTGATFDSNSNKVVITFRHTGSSSNGTAVVGTVSGTDITFGSLVVFNAAATNYPAPQFDSNSNMVVVSYFNSATSVGSLVAGTVSGTSITFGSATAFNTGTTNYIKNTFDSNSNKVVTVYRDDGNSNYGTAVVFKPDTRTTTRGQVASGSSASVDIIGTVSENQTGLTAGQSYFVQTDGTIGLTAGSPSVFAGTAISATKLLVKT